MGSEPFAGGNKTNKSVLAPLERRLAPWVVPRIPRWIETYHLTLLTVVWSAGVIGFSALAARDLRWLWAVSLMIAMQWATDHFDGKLGKFRNTGLVRWGYFMDHILDYVFLCAIVIGYALILPERAAFPLLCLLAVMSGFMAHAFLAFATSNTLTISHAGAGPTEFRLALIIINTLLIRYGTVRMMGALKYVVAGGLIMLTTLVYSTQRRIWRIDMEERRRGA
jgi:phosphatidylglycerophosphate synthase